MVIPDPVTV